MRADLHGRSINVQDRPAGVVVIIIWLRRLPKFGIPLARTLVDKQVDCTAAVFCASITFTLRAWEVLSPSEKTLEH